MKFKDYMKLGAGFYIGFSLAKTFDKALGHELMKNEHVHKIVDDFWKTPYTVEHASATRKETVKMGFQPTE